VIPEKMKALSNGGFSRLRAQKNKNVYWSKFWDNSTANGRKAKKIAGNRRKHLILYI